MAKANQSNRRSPTRGGVVLSAAIVRPSATSDLQLFCREVTATPETAIAFLQRAGLVTATGRPRQLIRGKPLVSVPEAASVDLTRFRGPISVSNTKQLKIESIHTQRLQSLRKQKSSSKYKKC